MPGKEGPKERQLREMREANSARSEAETKAILANLRKATAEVPVRKPRRKKRR